MQKEIFLYKNHIHFTINEQTHTLVIFMHQQNENKTISLHFVNKEILLAQISDRSRPIKRSTMERLCSTVFIEPAQVGHPSKL